VADPTVRTRVTAQDETAGVFRQASQRIQRWGAEAQSASTRFQDGFRKASGAVTNLAGDLLGLNNKVANVAEGLLTLAAGGAIATGVAAGITLIAAAFTHFGAEARKATEAYDRYMESLRRQTPLAIVGAQLDIVRARVASLEREQRELPPGLASAIVGRLQSARDDLARLERQYQDILASFEAGRAKTREEFAERAARERLREAGPLRAPFVGRRDVGAEGGTLIGLPGGVVLVPRFEDRSQRNVAFADTTRQGASAAQQQQAIEAASRAGAGLAMTVGGQQTAFESFNRTAIDTTAILGTLAEGFVGLAAAIPLGIPGLNLVAKATMKATAIIATVEGTVAIGKGLVKLAEGIFPPNPPLLASGAAMVARGRQLLSQAAAWGGGIGGGGAGAAGGAGSGAGFSRSTREAAERDRGQITIQVPRELGMQPGDPRWVDYLARSLEEFTGRRVVLAGV
jgi:hypothetical protein